METQNKYRDRARFNGLAAPWLDGNETLVTSFRNLLYGQEPSPESIWQRLRAAWTFRWQDSKLRDNLRREDERRQYGRELSAYQRLIDSAETYQTRQEMEIDF
jgi:hypothetical protein